MRLIDADVLLPMMKYATIDSEIGVVEFLVGVHNYEFLVFHFDVIVLFLFRVLYDCE